MSLSQRESRASFLRTFVFGVEDSLVSTVGLLSGIAIAGVSQKAILVGIVRAKISGLRQIKNAVRMVAIGGIAIAVCIAAGKITALV